MIEIAPTYMDLILISIVYFSTWLPILKGGWVSDDHEGLSKFSDRYDQKNHKTINSYQVDKKGKKEEFKNLQFNPHIPFPGSVIRWLRLNMGKTYQKIGTNEKDHDVYGFVQSPIKHHLFSLTLHFFNVILTYFFLSSLFGAKLALLSTVMFTVMPVACQAVAWCSGYGYLLCLFGAMIALNISQYTDNIFLHTQGVFAATIVSAYGLFAGAFTWVIMLLNGKWWAAGAALLILLINGYKQGRQIVGHRTNEFKKQNMGHSTFLNWRKPIVMVKTIGYYICLIAFPKRLGLFHEWGYHYNAKIERIDWRFWRGVVCLAAMGWAILHGGPVLRFAAVWFLAYIAIFSNFITAMQFVVDRYAFIPSLGISVALAYLLQPYPEVFWLLIGLYACRTWVHIRTFKDEISFYRSNCTNFPNSEVSLGNLGVALMHRGKPGAAVDTWREAISKNKNYDVPHYNLYSIMRANGRFDEAVKHLRECLKAEIVHFRDQWQKELDTMELQVKMAKPFKERIQTMNETLEAFK